MSLQLQIWISFQPQMCVWGCVGTWGWGEGGASLIHTPPGAHARRAVQAGSAGWRRSHGANQRRLWRTRYGWVSPCFRPRSSLNWFNTPSRRPANQDQTPQASLIVVKPEQDRFRESEHMGECIRGWLLRARSGPTLAHSPSRQTWSWTKTVPFRLLHPQRWKALRDPHPRQDDHL